MAGRRLLVSSSRQLSLRPALFRPVFLCSRARGSSGSAAVGPKLELILAWHWLRNNFAIEPSWLDGFPIVTKWRKTRTFANILRRYTYIYITSNYSGTCLQRNLPVRNTHDWCRSLYFGISWNPRDHLLLWEINSCGRFRLSKLGFSEWLRHWQLSICKILLEYWLISDYSCLD